MGYSNEVALLTKDGHILQVCASATVARKYYEHTRKGKSAISWTKEDNGKWRAIDGRANVVVESHYIFTNQDLRHVAN